MVGTIAAISGNSRIGLLSILILFLLGMWLLRKVEEAPAG
jgi:MFS-type transporter involved in bile tolerance (Atg22 family)